MPCGSAAPFEAVEVEDGVLEVWVPGAVVVVAGAFCAESTMVDCDEDREKVLEKGAPRWVSLSFLVSFHDMLVPVAVSRRLLGDQEVGTPVCHLFGLVVCTTGGDSPVLVFCEGQQRRRRRRRRPALL